MVKLKRELTLNHNSRRDVIFPGATWLASRLIIAIAMLLIAPLLPTPPNGVAVSFGWDVFNAWDSLQYENIVTSGYNYDPIGKGNVAFFPLFPLLLRFFMELGIPFEVAGVLINNLAFVGFLYLLYIWVKQNHGESVARVSVMVAACFPASIFATTIYTEGLYLFLSLLTVYSFENQRYGLMVVAGMLATATRPTGIALILALIIATIRQRKPFMVFLCAIATALGIGAFSAYCWFYHGDALAFVNAQKAWRTSLGFDWQSWWKMLMQVTIGNYNWKQGFIKDPAHPVAFVAIVALAFTLGRLRQRIGLARADYGWGILCILLWLLGGDPLINTSVVLGTAYLLWRFRQDLTPATLYYGVCGIGLLMASGGTWSLSRLVYGIFPCIVVMGILLAKNHRWQKMTIGFFGILLITFSIRFAQGLWVG